MRRFGLLLINLILRIFFYLNAIRYYKYLTTKKVKVSYLLIVPFLLDIFYLKNIQIIIIV